MNPLDLLPNHAIVISDQLHKSKEHNIVLALIPDSLTPYVTWVYYRNNPNSTCMGHYYESIIDAAYDFEKRLQ